MNFNYQIITDASADLQPDFADREHIAIIPMTFMLDEEEYTSNGIVPEDMLKHFYQGERDGKMTRTSQVPPQTYLDYFRSCAEKGESMLYLSLSGGLSGTYNTAQFAANEIMKQYPGIKIRCIDSRSATVGIELLLEKAAKNRSTGMTLEENAAWLEENRLRVCHWFMVDDLNYLKRNGRISSTTAFIGSTLNIKPLLRIENEGNLVNFEKKRGVKAALNQLLELYQQASDNEKGERIIIVHADNEAGADYLEMEVKKYNPDSVVTRAVLSPVIGCHTGPGLCAIAHWGKRIL